MIASRACSSCARGQFDHQRFAEFSSASASAAGHSCANMKRSACCGKPKRTLPCGGSDLSRPRLISASSAPNASSAPAGTYSRAILNRLLIDLSWASSQLEGSTCSRLDTRALIEHGQVAQGKAASGTQMILNHQAAIELLVENVQSAAHSNSESFHFHINKAIVMNPIHTGFRHGQTCTRGRICR